MKTYLHHSWSNLFGDFPSTTNTHISMLWHTYGKYMQIHYHTKLPIASMHIVPPIHKWYMAPSPLMLHQPTPYQPPHWLPQQNHPHSYSTPMIFSTLALHKNDYVQYSMIGSLFTLQHPYNHSHFSGGSSWNEHTSSDKLFWVVNSKSNKHNKLTPKGRSKIVPKSFETYKLTKEHWHFL